MKFFKDENAVSEVIGVMIILMVLVLYLGTIQAYEVPKWNTELEIRQFDIAYSDFINLRSNLEDVSAKNIPKTNSIHMGVRYPLRYMLYNPGPGAAGTITMYPVNITVDLKFLEGNSSTRNYSSRGIVYRLDGQSSFPDIIYEHGIIIRNFGKTNITDDQQSLLINNEIFIPVINWSMGPGSSMETISLNLKPYSTATSSNVTNLNITMDTEYPAVWSELLNGTNATVSDNKININISFSSHNITLPIIDATGEPIYTNMIMSDDRR